MLEIKNLNVVTGNFHLRDINLAVAEGECHAVIGPSGSGKSTLLHAVLGVLPAQNGRIQLGGKDITRLPIEQRGLGYVPQGLGLFSHLTVRENLAYSARARHMAASDFQPLINQLVEATGIGSLLDRKPETLSGGERQRVGIVRALASQPKVVLLDEPFTALNESLRRELWWLMRALQQERGLTVMLVTHDLSEAYFLSQTISVLLEGRIIQQGDKATVYGRPVAGDVARFLGIETLLPGRVVDVNDGLATVEVGTTRIVALAISAESKEVFVSIRGEDVTLQNHDTTATSARNRLVARIVAIHAGSPLMQVELDAGFPLTALITRPSFHELELQVGSTVIALVKAPSINLIPRRPGEKHS